MPSGDEVKGVTSSKTTMSIDDALLKALNDSHSHTFDEYILPGFRIWQLCAVLLAIAVVIVVIVCCFSKVRIPRTKRQIELSAAKRKMRKKQHQYKQQHSHTHSQDERAQTIVMNTLNHPAGRVSQSPDHLESPTLIQNSRQTAV